MRKASRWISDVSDVLQKRVKEEKHAHLIENPLQAQTDAETGRQTSGSLPLPEWGLAAEYTPGPDAQCCRTPWSPPWIQRKGTGNELWFGKTAPPAGYTQTVTY